jgi:hypothetical protein
METNDTPFNEQESLRIIHEMIAAAKNNVKADSFIFLLWGYLVFIASISQFILIRLNFNDQQNALPWLLMPVAGIIQIIYSIKKRKNEKIKTHVSELLKYTWLAFGVAMMIVLFFGSMDYLQGVPVIMTLYGIGLFISGSALQFKPLVVGGIFCWICAIVGFEIQNEYLLLILAAAVLGGYIIPGHMIQFNNKNKNV